MRTLALLASLVVPSMVSAQLFVGVRGGPVSHTGHARAPSEVDSPTLHPGVATDLVAVLGIDRRGWLAQVSLRHTAADLILGGESGGIITPGALRSRGLSAEVGRQVTGSVSGAAVHLLLGIVVDRWSFPIFEDAPRSRWSGSLAAEVTVPVSRRINGLLRIETTLGGGLFTVDELPTGFEKVTARRAALHLGGRVRWR